MANIRCPNCGKDNPDLLDVCQFCQTPLKPESVLRIGEKPTKKTTGELENILPDWLKNIQQQAKDAAEEDAVQAAASPKPLKDEPPDLLAGLASQTGSAEDEDIPDWLASINPTAKPKPVESSTPESTTDFFAQFNQKESKPEPVSEAPAQEELPPSSMSGQREEATIPFERDELSEWFTQASEQPEETVASDEGSGDMGWGSAFVPPSSAETSSPKEEEDLSWLHNLEAASKQTGGLEPPKPEMNWTADFETPSTPSPASQDDLSWLDRLGGIEEPAQPDTEQTAGPQPASQDDLSWLRHPAEFDGIPESPRPSQPSAPQEDLSWLNDLGAPTEPQPFDAAPNQPISEQPLAAQEDLDWLNKLGEPSEPIPSAPAFSLPDETAASTEDLSWLNNLGKSTEPSAASQPQEDLSWLNALGGESEPLSTPPFAEEAGTEKVSPRQTAPLNEKKVEGIEPDWLKSAAEAPSMPAPGDLSMDWFSGTLAQEKTPSATPQPVSSESDIFSVPSESAPLSNQEVDSLFSVDMPDWLSRPEAEAAGPVEQQTGTAPVEGDELAPVDLPSWVQAMRPVEAVITETASSVADQPAETEGPLAGLHGVIPIAPVGSPRKPKAVSLTLQVSEDQQASAMLLEEILGSETSPRALITSAFVASQHWLRWALTAAFLLILSAVIFLRSEMMPIPADPANLPAELSGLSTAVISIPANAKLLVVIDYEPSLAGEMEAVSAPLLSQIVLLGQPNLSFISTSPNGAALVERLMANTGIDQAGLQSQNLGYLPGGSAGVLGFIEAPSQIIPSAGVQFFSEYSALVVLTDHAESGRVWVEQLQNRKQVDLALTNQPLLLVTSAQAGPLLQPYVSSRQITGMLSGLSDAARYEVNNNRPGIARSYWDTFGIGLMMSVALIAVGSLWSLFTGIRARRASAEQG